MMAIVVLASTGCGAAGAELTGPQDYVTTTTTSPPETFEAGPGAERRAWDEIDVAACVLTLSTVDDGDQVAITWELESNRPGGTLTLRSAPGDEVLGTVELNDEGGASGSVTASRPNVSTWLTAWIASGDETEGCASVQFA
jgi:hypothetical protein